MTKLSGLLACAAALACGPAAAQVCTADCAVYLAELQARARTLDLAASPMWRTLLHYQVQPLLRWDRSLADDPGFFVAPNGKHQPQAELDATLAAFFDPEPRYAMDQAAACRFKARYNWLDAQLGFDAARLPRPHCDRYEDWRRGMNASRVTLVFPAAYLNSPASMYGHTFLRLDPERSGSEPSPLLSYAISYAAAGNEAEGVAFALKGLSGMYAGQFSNSPYYLRIRDYNDLENRDIWEYELNLTPPEIERLLAHTWELGSTRFDYYFFDENCSYHLLSLLDAARPGLGLSQRFTWWAIPVDTVRAVVDTPGLLKAIRYRPSNATELRERAERLGPQRTRLAQRLAEDKLKPAQLQDAEPDATLRAQTLELAERYVTYDALRHPSSEAQVQQRRMALLAARAQLPATPPSSVPTPQVPPHAGHHTARVDVLVGRRGGRSVLQLGLRPAYHDLLDPEPGFQRGSAITFFRLDLTHDADRRLTIDRFVPVDIVSLTPSAALMTARSWRVRFGWTRSWGPDPQHPDARAPLAFEINGGPGWATELRSDASLMAYAFLDNQLWVDRALPQRQVAVGSGVLAGILWDPTPKWRVQAQMYARASLASQPEESGLRMQQRVVLTRQLNLSLQCQLSRRAGVADQRECFVGLQRYW